MLKRTTICALILLAVCAFFAVEKANAQQVWGSTDVLIDTNLRRIYGYHATEVDFIAWQYYEPLVEGFIYDQFGNELDFDSDVNHTGFIAEAFTESSYQPGRTFYVISDHYVGLLVPAPSPEGGGPAYWNPFGFGFSGPGGFFDFWGFGPGSPGFVVVQYIYLGSTGWELEFFGEPRIDQISPTSAPLDSNIELHFEGVNLGGNPSVNISGSGVTTGQIIFSTETRLSLNISISANAPTGNRSVTISTRGYTSNAVTFRVGDQTPHIDSINPSRGNAGSVVDVTISGRNFGINPAVNVTGGITAQVLAGSTTTQINSRFTIPSGTASGDYSVTVFSNGLSGSGFQNPGSGSATSNSVPFTVNATAAPRINDFAPKSGQLGTTVEVNVMGENFGTSRTLVIGGQGVTVQSYTSVSDPDHQIVATLNIAANAEVGDHSLRVSAGGQLSNSVNFRVGDPSPVISSINPSSGVAGTTFPVVISGSGFGSDPSVAVSGNGVSVTINQKSNTNIQATFQIAATAEAVMRQVTVTSRGVNGNGFTQTPGTNQSATHPFDIKKAEVKIIFMDKQFAPGAERLNITYSITPVGTEAPFARLEIFKKGDDRNPIFVDPNIPKSGTAIQYQGQDGSAGWNGKDSNGNFIGAKGSPYTVKVSISDNAGFVNPKSNKKTFKLQMFVETSIAPTTPPNPPTPAPTPGTHKREYNIIKNWRSILTELSTNVTVKVQFLSKDGTTKKGTAIPFKVDWRFDDVDDTSDDSHIDPQGSQGNDNAEVVEGGKRGGTDDMWKVVTGFNATVNTGGQTANSDMATSGQDIGSTKISFLSSAIGGDNYKVFATIKNGSEIIEELRFEKWSVRKTLPFTGAYQISGGTDLRNFVRESVVEDAFNGEGYTDYSFDPVTIHQVAPPNTSEYLVEMLPPKPLSDPSPELPTQTELNDYENGTAQAKANAKALIEAKAQRWYERNLDHITTKLTEFLNSIDPTSDSVVGGNLYFYKYNGRNSGRTDFYPDGIQITEKTRATPKVATGVVFDPDTLWKAPNASGQPAPDQGFETQRGLHKICFVFSNVPNQDRKQKVGRHEIGHASDHVLFGFATDPNPNERDHWTDGLMHRTALTPDFAPDSILRLRGRKRRQP